VKSFALRRRLSRRKASLKRELVQRRRALRAQLQPQPKRSRPRRWRLLLLMLLLLLWSLLRACNHSPELLRPPALKPLPVQVKAAPMPSKVASVNAVVRSPLRNLKPRSRPSYQGEAPPSHTWLSAFRLQVAARSPRLSRCFEGVERAGAFKWSARVNSAQGIVSDHQLELLTGAALSKKIRTCLLKVFSEPPYQLPVQVKGPKSSRISMLMEF